MIPLLGNAPSGHVTPVNCHCWPLAPFREGIAQLGGQRYTVANFRQELKPLVNVDLNALLNMDDNSVLVQPRLNINLSNQTDLTLFSWLGFGREPQYNSGMVPIIHSEFGGINEGFGFFMRFYF
jgi:hypothetical protein